MAKECHLSLLIIYILLVCVTVIIAYLLIFGIN